MAVLVLHLKGKWWDEIASGRKTVELRLANEYWRKRLIGRHYDEINLWRGYPPSTDRSKLLRRKWRLVTLCTVVHEEFGVNPVDVFVIDVSQECC